jgi:hypothetical protein
MYSKEMTLAEGVDESAHGRMKSGRDGQRGNMMTDRAEDQA